MADEDKTEDPWENDKLGRKDDGLHLIKVLLSRYAARVEEGSGSYIVNIDASWGEGKTFFLECLRGELEQQGYSVASVNAWKDDLSNDPLTTIMAAIDRTLRPFTQKRRKAATALQNAKKALGVVALEGVKQVGGHALKLATGLSVESLAKTWNENRVDDLTDEQIDSAEEQASDLAAKAFEKGADRLIERRLTEHAAAQSAVERFRVSVSDALSTIDPQHFRLPLFVFIDELDRCRPLYAIKLLEELKHIFEINGVVFLVATDTEQLSHSVRAIYGSDFQGRKYLRRFFDRVFVFPDASRTEFIKHLFSLHAIDPDQTFHATGEVPVLARFEEWMSALDLKNRDIIQCFEIISSFVTSWQHDIKIEPIYLLSLVGSFYNSQWTLFDQLSRATPDAEMADLAGWKVSFWTRDGSRQRVKKVRQANTITGVLRRALDKNLYEVGDGDTEGLFDPFLRQEFHKLRGGRYSPGVAMRSVLAEYPSRVRNAGRVIDRDASSS